MEIGRGRERERGGGEEERESWNELCVGGVGTGGMNLVPNEVTAKINNSKPQQSLHSANNALCGRADHQPYLFTRHKLSLCYIGISFSNSGNFSCRVMQCHSMVLLTTHYECTPTCTTHVHLFSISQINCTIVTCRYNYYITML